ncbi:MAG: YggT family protein [Peptococcaceae bacterium]|nr:YggT family protein [Peptococcaceae bacterium]
MLSAGAVYTLYRAVRLAFRLYEVILFVRIILSWTNLNPYNSKIVRFLSDLTDPLLAQIERFMPQALLMPLNFSPIVAILLLSVVESVVLRLLMFLM